MRRTVLFVLRRRVPHCVPVFTVWPVRRILRFDHLLLKYRNVCPACDYDFRLRLPVIVLALRCPQPGRSCAPGDCDQFALTTFLPPANEVWGKIMFYSRLSFCSWGFSLTETPPPGERSLYGNEWSVRFLLECIPVWIRACWLSCTLYVW